MISAQNRGPLMQVYRTRGRYFHNLGSRKRGGRFCIISAHLFISFLLLPRFCFRLGLPSVTVDCSAFNTVSNPIQSLAAKRVSAVRAQDLFVPSQYYRSLATRAGEGRCRTVCGGRTDSVLHVFQSRMFLFIRFLFDGAVAAAVHASVRRLAKLVIAVQ